MSEAIITTSICICTYKRPQLLRNLLLSLAKQDISLNSFELVIVDNDSQGSAQEVVHIFSNEYPLLSIQYAIEAVQGIAYARNRTVSLARGELLAFIDDDEVALPDWLTKLTLCMDQFRADAVLGPVVAAYPAATPNWVIRSSFFERKRFNTGARMTWGDGHTGNALIKAVWAKNRRPHTFNEDLARSGGEDTDFFKWMQSKNASLIWCDIAVVHEMVSQERQSLKFMLRRSYVSSVTYWQARHAQHNVFIRTIEATVGIGLTLAYLFMSILKLPLGIEYFALNLVSAIKALGRVTALAAFDVVGYGKK